MVDWWAGAWVVVGLVGLALLGLVTGAVMPPPPPSITLTPTGTARPTKTPEAGREEQGCRMAHCFYLVLVMR